MNLLDPISKIMTSNPISVSPDDQLTLVHEVFSKKGIHHLPVLLGGTLVGMVSDTDFSFFKRGFQSKDDDDETIISIKLNQYKVSDIMVKKLAKLDINDRIEVAIDIFEKNILHALPVMDGDTLVGIVTTHDIIKAIAKDQTITKEYN